MQIDGIVPQPIQSSAEVTPSKQREEAKLQEACQQFESLFLQQIFSQMRKSIPKSNLFGEGKEEDNFQSMLDEERAKEMAKSGGIGLANILYQQVRKSL